jgi:hypothetical protein
VRRCECRALRRRLRSWQRATNGGHHGACCCFTCRECVCAAVAALAACCTSCLQQRKCTGERALGLIVSAALVPSSVWRRKGVSRGVQAADPGRNAASVAAEQPAIKHPNCRVHVFVANTMWRSWDCSGSLVLVIAQWHMSDGGVNSLTVWIEPSSHAMA